MNSMRRVFVCLGFMVAVCIAGGQSQPQAAPQPGIPDLASLVKQQFGSTFTLPAKFPTPLITADFDGDGVEDAVIVADSSEPFPDSFSFKYKVIDPYNAYFGLGNPSISASFSTVDPL